MMMREAMVDLQRREDQSERCGKSRSEIAPKRQGIEGPGENKPVWR
jgi:hypothetical protein